MGTTQERTAHLGKVVQLLLDAHTEWVEGDHDTLTPSDDLYALTEEAIELFDYGDCPSDLREHAKVIDVALRAAWIDFKGRREASAQGDLVLPHDRYWRAIAELRGCEHRRETPPLKPIEPVRCSLTCQPGTCQRCLYGQKVHPRQIARIYEWFTASGEPDLRMVDEEIAEPGKHSKDWIDPRLKHRQAQDAARQNRVDRINQLSLSKLQRVTAKPPESIEDLIRQGVSLRQITRMHRVSDEEVFAVADNVGLPRPALDYRDAHADRGTHEPEVNEHLERSMPSNRADQDAYDSTPPGPMVEDEPEELLDQDDDASDAPALNPEEQRVMDMWKDGSTVADINAATGLAKRKINAMIERWEQEG